LTVTIPSSAVGIRVGIINSAAQASGQYMYIGNVQLEIGSVATPFSRAGGTLSGELTACQRYYYSIPSSAIWSGNVTNGTNYYLTLFYPTTMRIAPTIVTTNSGSAYFPTTAITATAIGVNNFWVYLAANNTQPGGNYQVIYTASAEL
jgi:hypothetical protein